MKKSTESCEHVFVKPDSVCGPNLGWRCATCGERRERRMTAAERRAWSEYQKQSQKDLKVLHGPYHAFCKRFKDADGNWKLLGYEFMTAVDKWAAKYPDRIYCVPCDDTYFSSSQLVLITHEVPGGHWMGVTVIVISQCDGLPPKEFFLYPNHAEFLMKTLTGLKPRMKAQKKRKWPFGESRYETEKDRKLIDQDLLGLSGVAKICPECNQYYTAASPCPCDSVKVLETGISRAANSVRVSRE